MQILLGLQLVFSGHLRRSSHQPCSSTFFFDLLLFFDSLLLLDLLFFPDLLLLLDLRFLDLKYSSNLSSCSAAKAAAVKNT